jgi:hypothetical protein
MRVSGLNILSNKRNKLNTKSLIYKSLIKPMWTYGFLPWGNFNKIQTVQNKILRSIAKVFSYISNFTLLSDLKIKILINYR